MNEQPQDPPPWRRLPRPDDREPFEAGRDPDPPAGYPAPGRARGLRQVRRWSNVTAAALIAATVLATGYFVRAAQHPAASATVQAGTSQPSASPGQPCVTVPVVTSGGSGVTKQTTVRSCGTGTSTSAPVLITTGRQGERGDN